MLAKIYRPARSVMQSGQANTREWVLEFLASEAKVLDPLMGWTGSSDMNSQVTLRFDSREAAIGYAREAGLAFQVLEPKPRRHVLRINGYGDNFSPQRRAPWTH